MKTKKRLAFVILYAVITAFTVGAAEGAGTGAIKYSFQYKDPSTGAATNLLNSFIYLHSATKNAPMEKFFSPADFIGCQNFSNGAYLVANVPAGTWYVRIIQRGGNRWPYGPPETGDYTWFQTTPITVVAGQTLDLGTQYATIFGAPITITGTVKNASGVPLAGRYVRATTEPCRQNTNCSNNATYCEQFTNECGPNKFMALQPTDANGTYTLQLRDAGTYYVSSFTNWDTTIGCSGYCAPAIYGSADSQQQITVQTGDNKVLNITGN